MCGCKCDQVVETIRRLGAWCSGTGIFTVDMGPRALRQTRSLSRTTHSLMIRAGESLGCCMPDQMFAMLEADYHREHLGKSQRCLTPHLAFPTAKASKPARSSTTLRQPHCTPIHNLCAQTPQRDHLLNLHHVDHRLVYVRS